MCGHGPTPAIEPVVVVSNERVATGVCRVVLDAPRTAATVEPGQFVHVRIARSADFILRRPFSVHRARGERLEIIYQVVGRGTRVLEDARPGDVMDVLGPLGHGWTVPEGTTRALVVAGGLGAAPMGMLVERLAEADVQITLAQGAPSAGRLLARELFDSLCRRSVVATDDGSAGTCGFVTVLSAELLQRERPDVAYVCGPEPMQRIVAGQCAEAGVACQVSLERLMACGVGACLSCVVATRHGQKRACVDGPVFDAADVVWDSDEDPEAER
ncbi:MAG: dihydroorotate dehydrogenase electron transfer subunit [Coriobacteriia bacterium]|nr:dihydroorotate dehydrogenase electron transfer subunit [Coriobacteriia bacterium]MBN2841012.1 dihydroorotate dehydrogenase electron transfer subunit [Coriobacteriia bacterium]